MAKNVGGDWPHLQKPLKVDYIAAKVDSLTGDFVSLDGRNEVIDNNGYVINAQDAGVLSEFFCLL